jgi:hypothetical protein
MKNLFFIIGVFVSNTLFGQDCFCEEDTLLNEYISCEPNFLDNNSKLYWNFNCDSSWLTFETNKGFKNNIFSLGEELVSLTSRLGYVDWFEFNNSVLFTNSVISGCCEPNDYYLHDKDSGNLIKYLGKALYVSEDRNIPIVVGVNYTTFNTNSNSDLNSLLIYNLDNNQEFTIGIQEGDIKKGMVNNEFFHPEYVFDSAEIKEGKLIIRYFVDNYKNTKDLEYKSIHIDVSKYIQQ